MQPKMCTKCKKNVAVVFITKIENGVTMNEGYCLKCARSLGIPQIDTAVKQMGFSEEDLESLSEEMSSMFGQMEDTSEDGDEVEGQTATFPLLNQLFGAGNLPAKSESASETNGDQAEQQASKKKSKKHKFLDSYCLNLTGRAREGKLDKVIGRDVETERLIQILNRRQKNNPCLIGEPGVGKTAIAEGLAQRIVSGDVPYKLRDKEVFLLDLTALVAGTQFRGQFESRMKSLIGEIKACGNIILVIDEAAQPDMLNAFACFLVSDWMGVSNAFIAAEIALATNGKCLVPFDEVIAVMYNVGRNIPYQLRETALGGLASAPSVKNIRPGCAACGGCK